MESIFETTKNSEPQTYQMYLLLCHEVKDWKLEAYECREQYIDFEKASFNLMKELSNYYYGTPVMGSDLTDYVTKVGLNSIKWMTLAKLFIQAVIDEEDIKPEENAQVEFEWLPLEDAWKDLTNEINAISIAATNTLLSPKTRMYMNDTVVHIAEEMEQLRIHLLYAQLLHEKNS